MSANLSQDQKQRMEENRRRAMEIRAAKAKSQSLPASCSSHSSNQSSNQLAVKASSNVTSTKFFGSGSFSKPSSGNVSTKSATSTTNSCPNTNGSKNNSNWKRFASKGGQQTSSPIKGPLIKTGSLTLISKDRFELVMDYHEPTINSIKTISGREYDVNKKRWNFPLSQYINFLATIRKLQPAVAVGELPKLVVETFIRRKNLYPEVDLSRIHSSMRSALMDFQVEGVKFAVSRGGRVLIADDMGLGKTIQALAIADYYREDWPLLIVCPSSMRFQWVEEIRKHLRNVNLEEIFVITNGKDVFEEYSKVVITSYDLMSTFKDRLLTKKFGVVIMDESHYLKNPKTVRTKVGTELVTKCKRCVLLSGTPVLSRPSELYCQLFCIKPQLFKNFMEFAVRYCDAKKDRFGWDFSGSSNMMELGILLKELLMIRRLKSEVLSQLPPKRRDVVVLESSGKKLSETSELAKALALEGLKGIEKRSTLMQYFYQTGLAKMKGIMQYVQDMIASGEKFLVFAHHVKVLDGICEAVEATKTDYIRIDGSVHSEVRKQLCNYFQEQENCLVAVLSIKAANTGLTLTAAHVVIFAELFWNPGDLIQAEDRVHRIGQVDSVLIQYLVQHGTADDLIWPLIQDKLDILNKAGLSKDDFRDADTVLVKSQEKKDIMDYFLKEEDDSALAELDLSQFEDNFEIPEKRLKLE